MLSACLWQVICSGPLDRFVLGAGCNQGVCSMQTTRQRESGKKKGLGHNERVCTKGTAKRQRDTDELASRLNANAC